MNQTPTPVHQPCLGFPSRLAPGRPPAIDKALSKAPDCSAASLVPVPGEKRAGSRSHELFALNNQPPWSRGGTGGLGKHQADNPDLAICLSGCQMASLGGVARGSSKRAQEVGKLQVRATGQGWMDTQTDCSACPCTRGLQLPPPSTPPSDRLAPHCPSTPPPAAAGTAPSQSQPTPPMYIPPTHTGETCHVSPPGTAEDLAHSLQSTDHGKLQREEWLNPSSISATGIAAPATGTQSHEATRDQATRHEKHPRTQWCVARGQPWQGRVAQPARFPRAICQQIIPSYTDKE